MTTTTAGKEVVMSDKDHSRHNSTAEQFNAGTTPEDVPLDQYRQAVYRPTADGFDAPDGHEPEGEDLFIAPDAADLAGLNVELIEAIERGATFDHDLVADLAGVMAIEEIARDRERAYHTYEAIKQAGKGPFLSTPDGELFVYQNGIWLGHPSGEQRLRELAREALGQFYGENVLRELREQVRSSDTVDRAELGRPPGTVATPDGLLDIRTGDVRPLRPSDRALGRITVAPNPEADIGGSRFWRYIEDAVPDGTERAKLQEYAGYTLLPGQPFKKALFAVGPTDSGKGTFLKAIEAVLGRENVSHQSLHNLINSRWGTDKIHGKLANMANEVSPGAVKRVERFKELTGGEDTVTAERKSQPTYEFTVTQKFLFATNQFPSVSHADDAFFNRCLFVEFPNTVPPEDKDPGLLDDLRDERATILNWMLDGLTRLLDREQFAGEQSLDDKRALTRSFGGPVEQFVYEALEVTADPQDVIQKAGLYDAFTRYCHFQQFDNTPVKGSFTKALTKRPGVDTGRSRRVAGADADEDRPHVYQGVRPVPDTFRRIQADVPPHAAAEDAEQRTQQDVLEDAR